MGCRRPVDVDDGEAFVRWLRNTTETISAIAAGEANRSFTLERLDGTLRWAIRINRGWEKLTDGGVRPPPGQRGFLGKHDILRGSGSSLLHHKRRDWPRGLAGPQGEIEGAGVRYLGT